MRYVPIAVIETVEVGQDVLGNPVVELHVHPTPYRGEMSGKDVLRKDLDGRSVTQNVPYIWTDMPPDALQHADGIRVGTDDFKVLEVYAGLRGRWSGATLERWRQDAHSDHP